MIKQYLLDVRPLKNDVLFQRTYTLVPALRQKKVSAFLFASDKRLSLGAGYILQYALQKFGVAKDASIKLNQYGKPFLCGYPDILFNLSHSGNYVLCVMGSKDDTGELLGCDIQQNEKFDFEIVNQVFTPAEYHYIKNLPVQEQQNAILQLWTCKESYIKALGLGLQKPLNSFSIQLCGKNSQPVLAEPAQNPLPYFQISFIDSEYAVAVCSGKPIHLQLELVSFPLYGEQPQFF